MQKKVQLYPIKWISNKIECITSWHKPFLIILALLFSIQAFSQGGLSKKIALSIREVSPKTALEEIQRKSGSRILFGENINQYSGNKVSISNTAISVKEALSIALKNTDLTYQQAGNSILVKLKTAGSKAQEPSEKQQSVEQLKNEIKGLVQDESGQPLTGVSIMLKNQKAGFSRATQSDSSGTFRFFNIPAGGSYILTASYIGFETQSLTDYTVNPTSNSSITIKLKSSTQTLDQVVVVGYGTQKRENLTNSVSTISGQVLENRPLTRISQGLQGMVAGLNITSNTGGGSPDATQNINIRGYTGPDATGAPLIIVDGVQGGDINNINPDDVESISVLKDAAATAIYGSSAPYGAILVTTKKGKKNQKATITYNNSFNWAQPINLPTMLNSLKFSELYNEVATNAGLSPVFTQEVLDRIKAYYDGATKDETVANAQGTAWQSYEAGNANNDWFKIYFKDNSFSQQHNLGVSGGSDKTTYYVGAGYNFKNGMYRFGNDNFKRYNIRANVSTNISSWLTFNFRSSYSKSLFDTPDPYSGRTGGGYGAYMHQIARKWPTVSLFNPDGNYSDQSDVLLHLEGGRDKKTTDQPMITGELIFTPLKDWNITANYTFDGSVAETQNFLKTVYSYRPDGIAVPIGSTSPNNFSRSSERNEHQVVNLFTSYEKQIKKHYFKALGGFTSELTNYSTFSAGNSNLYSNDLPALSLTYGTAPSNSDQSRSLAVAGYFGRLNYSFANKYLVEFNGRYDATSRFLANKRWKFSPGVSAGWNVDREKFWAALKPTINAFKIRGAYGSSPDQLFLGSPSVATWYPFYPSLATVRPTATTWFFNNIQEAAVSQPPLVNTDLTWVTQTSYGIAADMGLLTNRLNLTFEYFVREAKDFAGPAMVLPALLGTGVPTINNAAIQNKGFDLTIEWRDRIGTDFGYSFRGVLSDYKGKVTDYNNPTNNLGTFYVGKQLGEIWGYITDGYYTDETAKNPIPTSFWSGRWTAGDIKYRDLDGNKIIDNGDNTLSKPGDRTVIGNSTPRYQYSFTLNADYKGFDLMMFFQGIGKRDAWVSSNYFWGFVGNQYQSSPFTVHLDRWSPETPNGYFPKAYMNSENNKNTQTQTKYLQDASYLRFKTLQLGYTVPKSILTKLGMQRLRFFANAENLATFTKLLKTMDPELSINDAKIYPLQRTYSLGLNVTF